VKPVFDENNVQVVRVPHECREGVMCRTQPCCNPRFRFSCDESHYDIYLGMCCWGWSKWQTAHEYLIAAIPDLRDKIVTEYDWRELRKKIWASDSNQTGLRATRTWQPGAVFIDVPRTIKLCEVPPTICCVCGAARAKWMEHLGEWVCSKACRRTHKITCPICEAMHGGPSVKECEGKIWLLELIQKSGCCSASCYEAFSAKRSNYWRDHWRREGRRQRMFNAVTKASLLLENK
jgi:hypothetical protein